MVRQVFWQDTKIKREDRERLNRHPGICVWFTGLSGSGKSTLAIELEKEFFQKGFHTYLLDGDNVRHGLNKDLGFTAADRKENIRRIGELSALFVDAGLIVFTAFISPYREDREFIRNLLPASRFIEVYVDCDIETCEKRDPKGLYKRARTGELEYFTGISAPYEAPKKPDYKVFNGKNSNIDENIKKLKEFIVKYIENLK